MVISGIFPGLICLGILFANFVLCGFTPSSNTRFDTTEMPLDMTPSSESMATEKRQDVTSTSVSQISQLMVTTPKDNVTRRVKEATKKKATETNYVDLVFVPIGFVLGCIGNSITVVTMATLPFRRMTWSIVLISLAFADTIMLWVIAVRKPFMNDLFGVDILALTSAGCKIFHFTRRAAKMMSSWFVVLICVERFVAICFPLKVKEICTRRKIFAAIVVICSVGVLFGGISTDTVILIGPVCRPADPNPAKQLQGQISLLIGSSLMAVIPMLILLVLTPIICVTLLRQRRARTKLASSTENMDPFSRVSAMLVSVHSSYIILVLPHFVLTNFKFVRTFNPRLYDKDAMAMLEQVSGLFELTNHSINFLLYVGLNSMFRKRLVGAFSRTSSITDVSG